MRRRLSIALAAGGLVVALAAAVLGVRSFYVQDDLNYETPANWTALIISKQGRFDVLYLTPWRCDEPGWTHRGYPASNSLGGTDYSRRVLGFGSGVQLNGGLFVNVPYWSLMLLTALPALMVIRSELRRRRFRAGGCPVCGYDLRASPDRCPECGAEAAIAPREVIA